ncbi:PIN-like domain-containing protein [Nocardia nova]|uniref:PIN-like domain-containing protein n=1 Tax=Nocardia nova TaxID=37330 RepID=UPI0018958F34|nr:PIN-like domain-containing protein [Nocardia nova]MBF6148045.1 hypothetical protein [Nocardia nova]
MGTHADRVYDLLARSEGDYFPISSHPLVGGDIDGSVQATISGQLAIGLDASALLHFVRAQNSSDIIDKLNVFQGIIIVPPQAIQEFWNNISSQASDPVSKIHKSIESLIATEERRISQGLPRSDSDVDIFLSWKEAIEGYMTERRGIDSADIRDAAKSLIELIRDRASTPSVPSVKFMPLAEVRHAIKSPPGFKDPARRHGDFFVWSEFLVGLSIADESAAESDRKVTFVSGDKKADWLVAGLPHPVLSAEVYNLVQGDLRILEPDAFVRALLRS